MLELLSEEIKLIESRSVRQFTEKALKAADENFWKVPCSSSGRFHPPEDNGEQGLVRHVKKAVYVGTQYARREKFEGYEHDAMVSAIILHDIKKNGEPWGKDTDYRHGIIAANYLGNFSLRDNTLKKIITDAVRYHMAPWNTTIDNERLYKMLAKNKDVIFTAEEMYLEVEERLRGKSPTRVEAAVQNADYWASREGMSFIPGYTIMPDTNRKKELCRHDSPEQWLKGIMELNGMKEKSGIIIGEKESDNVGPFSAKEYK